jgi:hypothetical protein
MQEFQVQNPSKQANELPLEFLGAKSDAASKPPDITVNILHD